MLCELKSDLPVSGAVVGNPLARIIDGMPMPTVRPANDDTAFRPCLLERRRRRMKRRDAR